jgi:hypothetical protein
MMKLVPVFAVALALIPGCREAGKESVASTPSAKPMVELFNGKDFSGWKLFMKDGSDPAKVWSIANGVIKCVGNPSGYMRTEKPYENYKVTVEWRFITPGNTGVMVHMALPDKVWPRSFECQGMHNHQGDFWMWEGADCKEPKIPGKNGFVKTGKSNEKAPGEWNTYQVECVGSTIKIYVNGKLMNTATECNASSGFIGLQSEGAEMEVRKVTLEPVGK